MGQGTESCGGYEIEYDKYEEALCDGLWIQKDGSVIRPSDMTNQHLRGAKRLCEKMSQSSTFSCDTDKWQDWIDIFDDELTSRGELTFHVAKYTSPKEVKPTRGKKIELKCHCGTVYSPRLADLKRGWGKSCSKRCASIKRDYGRANPVCVITGVSVKELLKDR